MTCSIVVDPGFVGLSSFMEGEGLGDYQNWNCRQRVDSHMESGTAGFF